VDHLGWVEQSQQAFNDILIVFADQFVLQITSELIRDVESQLQTNFTCSVSRSRTDIRGIVMSATSWRLVVLIVVITLSGSQSLAGTIPLSEKRSVAPILQAITPSVVNIATKKVEVVGKRMLRDPVMRELFDFPEQKLRRETEGAVPV
jgi:hypothetical protein